MDISNISSDLLYIQMREISELPREIAKEQIEISEKMVEVAVESKINGNGENIDVYA